MKSRDFLVVGHYLKTEMDARAIRSALDLGVIDALNRNGPETLDRLAETRRINPVGLRLLVDLLEANGVVAMAGKTVGLTPGFVEVLRFRDLLESRIAFADLVWPDIHGLFTQLLTNLPEFMARSKVFNLFRYDRCIDITAENLDATAAWTRFTTCLTKYESAAVFELVDLSTVGTMIDMGGNTGEFARLFCEAQPLRSATVVDLPVVCELGRRHILAQMDADSTARIVFFPADMRVQPLPEPADLVCFKSVLHDWPDADAKRLLARGASIVRPGGRILIFERAPIDARGGGLSYAAAPDLVFLHFLRAPDLYLDTLATLGFESIEYQRVELDMGFHMIVARRPA